MQSAVIEVIQISRPIPAVPTCPKMAEGAGGTKPKQLQIIVIYIWYRGFMTRPAPGATGPVDFPALWPYQGEKFAIRGGGPA